MQKQPYPPGYEQTLQAQSNANTYLAASADPSSPYFKNLMEVEEQRQRGDLVSSIQDIIRANQARGGRGAFVNPERRDETVWRALMQGFREAGFRSREMARNRLLDMAGASSRVASGYGPAMQYAATTDFLNRASRMAGTQGAFEAANRLPAAIDRAFGTKPGNKDFGVASIPTGWSTMSAFDKDMYYRPWGA
jgi:hypothetical protein